MNFFCEDSEIKQIEKEIKMFTQDLWQHFSHNNFWSFVVFGHIVCDSEGFFFSVHISIKAFECSSVSKLFNIFSTSFVREKPLTLTT